MPVFDVTVTVRNNARRMPTKTATSIPRQLGTRPPPGYRGPLPQRHPLGVGGPRLPCVGARFSTLKGVGRWLTP